MREFAARIFALDFGFPDPRLSVLIRGKVDFHFWQFLAIPAMLAILSPPTLPLLALLLQTKGLMPFNWAVERLLTACRKPFDRPVERPDDHCFSSFSYASADSDFYSLVNTDSGLNAEC